MKYITKIILNNFQSHSNSVLEFDPKLNIIVGESDSGKTAILRAIKWVLYNEPLGDFFIQEGKEFCSVEIFFNDNIRVKRYRSKSKNQYILTLPNGTEEIYEGFGTNVPEEIINATGIKKMELDQNESRTINLSEQLEGAFLLSEKDSVKASSIGRLVGVNIIDDALRESISDARNLNMDKNRIENDIQILEKEFEKYNYLDSLELKVNQISEIQKKLETKIKRKEKLDSYLESKNRIYKMTSVTNKGLNHLKEIDSIEKDLFIIDKKIKNYSFLNNTFIKLNSILKETKVYKKQLSLLENIELYDIYLKQIEINLNKYLNLKTLYTNLENINKDVYKLNEKLKLLENLDLEYNILDKINNNLNLYTEYINIYSKLEDTISRLRYGEKYTSKFKDLNYINDSIKTLEFKIKKLKILKELNQDLNIIYKEKEKINIYLKESRNHNKLLINEYELLLRKQDACPLCNSKLDENHINKIIEGYMEDIVNEI